MTSPCSLMTAACRAISNSCVFSFSWGRKWWIYIYAMPAPCKVNCIRVSPVFLFILLFDIYFNKTSPFNSHEFLGSSHESLSPRTVEGSENKATYGWVLLLIISGIILKFLSISCKTVKLTWNSSSVNPAVFPSKVTVRNINAKMWKAAILSRWLTCIYLRFIHVIPTSSFLGIPNTCSTHFNAS